MSEPRMNDPERLNNFSSAGAGYPRCGDDEARLPLPPNPSLVLECNEVEGVRFEGEWDES